MNTMKRETLFGFVVCLLLSASGYGDALVDPTRPPSARAVTTSTGEQPFKLEAIFASGEKRTAIVNGKLLAVGDRLGDAVIDRISENSIGYTRRGRAYVSTLPAAQRLNIRSAVSQGTSP